jgi:hypothetical protein
MNYFQNYTVTFIYWVMLNSVPGYLLSIPKRKNKVKVNVEQMIFYNFEVLNVQITRQSFFISKLN